MESLLVRKCIEVATDSPAAIEKWRRQRRTLERMPSHLAEALLQRLHRRRLLYPSLLEVFKYIVEEVDLRGDKSVDEEWMAYLGGFRYLHSMNLADCHKINNAAIWSTTGMKCLTELNLSRIPKITNAGVKHLVSVSTLEKLYLSETGVTADGVKDLASLSKLMVLDLGGLPVTNSALSSLQALKNLEHLDIWGSEVSNEGVIILTLFPNLSNLNVAWTRVTRLPYLPALTQLNMSNCTVHSLSDGEDLKPCLKKLILAEARITDESKVFECIDTAWLTFLDLSYSTLESFSLLHCVNALTHLNLSGSAVTDDSIKHIGYVGANIKYLDLSGTKVTIEGVAALRGKFPILETLVLVRTSIGDRAIAYISMLKSLKALNLSNTYVRGLIYQKGNDPEELPSFYALQKLIHLEKLQLEGLRLLDTAVPALTTLVTLNHLSLRSVHLTDETLYHLSSAPNLKHLGICGAVLTDFGLSQFVPPRTLEVLDLDDCWLLTKDALVQFSYKHPRIELRHELFDPNEMHSTKQLSSQLDDLTILNTLKQIRG
ncbi:uncharacterized protein LOC127255704 isoform X2 [Andrographis paniculata]|uniref:uncharacterized protein LOC127255704 isoform X2 n=1 Tax=Andrographis paniculata TaxID=175694 RepID=UPI0021E738AA|nr:uncharacterized protein LOC127255704 isoform X2 [Andrographis paniculata]